MPFRNDTSLVAFRYDQAAQAEPPIPIGPAKSSLRCQPPAVAAAAVVAARAATAGAKVIVTLDVQPTSCISALAPTTAATNAASSSSSSPTSAVPNLARTRPYSMPVSGPTIDATPTLKCITPIPAVVAPPHPPASGSLPVLSETKEHLHPALRSDPRSSDPENSKKKRDSRHAPTTTSIFTFTASLSQTRTFCNESSEEKEGAKENEELFPHTKILFARISKFVSALVIPSLQIRSSSPTSLYAQTRNELGRDNLDLGGANDNRASGIPLRSPGLAEGRTVTSASPTTTTPSFPIEKISASSTVFSRRCFSFQTFRRKKQQQQRPLSESPAEVGDENPSTANHTLSPDDAKASSTAPGHRVAPPRLRDEQISRVHIILALVRQSLLSS